MVAIKGWRTYSIDPKDAKAFAKEGYTIAENIVMRPEDPVDALAEEIAGEPKRVAMLMRLAILSDKDLERLVRKFKEERYE